jgi:hypothetical protein
MPRGKKVPLDEKQLTKGQLRKLNALRKSLGEKIAEKAFREWLKTSVDEQALTDKNAQLIADALAPLIAQGKLRIPRGGYLVTRGRGRMIVAQAGSG